MLITIFFNRINNMEILKYSIEDSTIAELLGVQNFTNKESAVLELVKNAFDAKASKLNIIISRKNNSLIFRDNGEGMNKNDIKYHWMHVGKSPKTCEYETIDNENKIRVLAGSKGIGRFALSRLGGIVLLKSQKLSNKQVVWNTDWMTTTLTISDELTNRGTEIVINRLRDRWSKSDIKELVNFLSRTCNQNLMTITITSDDEVIEVPRYFKLGKLGVNCVSIIHLTYLSKKKELICRVESDEFLEEAEQYCKNIDLKNHNEVINIQNYLDGQFKKSDEYNHLNELLEEIGDFKATLYFSLKDSSSIDKDKFLYKYIKIPDKYSAGVILYRNNFSISSYDGKKDWLELGKRSRLSPAAATHLTGSWRVRENQLSGMVNIDKKINQYLKDLSNRQGLDENEHYDLFIRILHIGLNTFERYRQNIIRCIDTKNKEKIIREKKVSDEIEKNPGIIRKLSIEEAKLLASEIRNYKTESIFYQKKISDTEEKYKYDVRLLNILATSGLRATSLAHEMNNDRNMIASVIDNIIYAMKKYNVWDIVNKSENRKYIELDIPELLISNKTINLKMLSFMGVILSKIEKRHFISQDYNVLDIFGPIKEDWEREYSWIQINLSVEEEIYFQISKDVINVIFDNLILNSIQQNDQINKLEINIKVKYQGEKLDFSYEDNGVGLPKKYLKDPRRILEVHESSRKDGHGLGMWMVHNTVVMTGGEIKDISSDSGFSIQFTIGKENND